MIQRESPAPIPREHRSTEGPVRTCIGCRKRELAVDLLRMVAQSGDPGGRPSGAVVVVDRAGNLSGRGAWLHPNPQCLQDALRRRAFTRALRIAGSPDTSAVVEHYTAATEQVAKNMSTP
ncbi:YlxR family protein [Mycolicibacterium confluentis]|nr:YlxR family protein [Mycolicibacterium confluentis]MCV7317691.1 YlxR family protein [Mycolicibacterium confluentis]